MKDKDLQQLFSALKKAESQSAPDFDELLARPESSLATKSNRLTRIYTISRIAVAASVLLLITFGVWRFSGLTNEGKQEELALEWIEHPEQENILNWTADSDELLPTENSRHTTQQQLNQPTKKTTTPKNTHRGEKAELSEATQEMIAKNPELDEALFEKGSISDWESPSEYLMPESFSIFGY